jgi:hypothetical protein
VDPDSPAIEEMEWRIGCVLLDAQPEFWTYWLKPSKGRPRGSGNKVLGAVVSKEALRQRRRRQKKRDKYSI